MTASSSSPSTPPQCGGGGGSGDQRYRDKRSRNNAAVKKCREIKRKHERETIEELAKEKKKFKELTEQQYLLETEVKIIQELIPYCRNKRQEELLPSSNK
uniref:BZIP domain-containing protein n=1 Tax=Panagrolaimus superbus TaxID=310955 RepID=A0A914YYV0_9BILA